MEMRCSSIASSSALCVLAVARLTSSISTICEKKRTAMKYEALLALIED